ncbi:MAG: hypothetical protein ACI8UD_004051 [Planctomycetota bacterium]|jgi:hypothetical protein
MTTFPDDDDGAVLTSLVEAGFDLGKPLEIEFHVAVPDEESGKKVAAAVTAGGYTCELVFDEGEPEDGEAEESGESHQDECLSEDGASDDEFVPMWRVCVMVEMLPEHQRIVDIQVELESFSKPHGGGSHGWGVLI